MIRSHVFNHRFVHLHVIFVSFPGYEWLLLDACYLQGCTSASQIQSWTEFLSKLGVIQHLAITKRPTTLTREQLVRIFILQLVKNDFVVLLT